MSATLLKSIANAMQYISASLDVGLPWPKAVLNLSKYLQVFTLGVEIEAPECLATNTYSWYGVFWGGAVGYPLAVAIFVFALDWYLRRRVSSLLDAIQFDEKQGFSFGGTLGGFGRGVSRFFGGGGEGGKDENTMAARDASIRVHSHANESIFSL